MKRGQAWLADAVRRRRGALTLRDLGRKLGVSPATLSRIEAGKMPTVEVYCKICDWIASSGFDAYACKPGVSYTLGGQTWVMTERPPRLQMDGHELLFRNATAPTIARWVHPDELQHLHRLGVVTVPESSTK